MPRRDPPQPLSPRAAARLRGADRGRAEALQTAPDAVSPAPARGGAPSPFVPTEAELRGPAAERDGADGGRHARARVPGRWVRLPAAFSGARWQPRAPAVVGVVVIVALVAAIFGVRVAWARQSDGGSVIAPGGGARAGPVQVAAGGSSLDGAGAGGEGAGEEGVPEGQPGAAGAGDEGAGGAAQSGQGFATAGPATASGGGATASGVPDGAGGSAPDLVVHVVGQVREPGVLRLPSGSRVSDAVAAAGGATPGADLGRINLARPLTDGEQVRVPAPGEEVPEPPAPGSAGGGGGGGGGSGGGSGAGPGALVPLNTADLATLDTLPGVGPVLAQRILDWRVAHGRFTTVDELSEVSGIGEKMLAQLRPLVTV